jgi:hypothetical protein
MSKTVQIDAAAHGILDVFAHENELESGVATQFRLASIFPHNGAFRREKSTSGTRSIHDHDKEMRTPSLQLYCSTRKESLQRYMRRCEEDTRTDLPMQTPEVQ